MLVILTCFANCEPFGFLTRRTPVCMLPVLNKSLMEHLLEQCADHGLTRIRIALLEHPRPVREFVGNGERWGLNIHTWNFREPCDDEVLVRRLAEGNSGPVLIVPAETLIDVDLKAVQAFHEQGPQSVTRVHARQACLLKATSDARPESGQIPCTGPMLDTGIRVVNPPSESPSHEGVFECAGTWLRVDHPTKLWEANIAAVGGAFSGLPPSDTAFIGAGQWTGHHCKIDPRSTIGSPVFLGNHVYIGSGAEIKGGSVLGNGVIVDSQALVESSVVMDHTYIGTFINVADKIASGKNVFNVKTGSVLNVEDPVIVAELREKILGRVARRFTDKVLAFLLFLATCPLWIFIGLLRVAKGNPFFDCQTLVVGEGGSDGTAPPSSSRVTLLRFSGAHPLVSRLPGLWDVVKGRLALVGIRPLTEEEAANLTEAWMMPRFDSPPGLFTMVDTLAPEQLDEYEKLVIENYYASTRRLTSDVKILCQSLISLIIAR